MNSFARRTRRWLAAHGGTARRPHAAAQDAEGVWFAVLCMGRSGSTYLTRLLDSNDDIVCLGEAFGPGYPPPAYPVGGTLSRRDWLVQTLGDRPETARGFKLPIEALFLHPALLGDLEALSARTVLLTRRNKLAQFISMRLAQVNDMWSSIAPYPVQHIAVDPWTFVGFVVSSQMQDMALAKFASAFPHIVIDYEGLADESRLAEVQAFLGVAPTALRTNTVRTRTASLREVISNFDELSRTLDGTPWGPALQRWVASESLSAARIPG